MNRKFYLLLAFVFVVIPAIGNTYHDRIVQAIAKTLDLHISPLQGGSSCPIFVVETPHGKRVVRFIDRKSYYDRAKEIQAQLMASQKGFGPQVYSADADTGMIVMDFVEENNHPMHIDISEKQLQQTAHALHNLHTTKDIYKSWTINDYIMNKCEEKRNDPKYAPFGVQISSLCRIVKQINSLFESSDFNTPIHGDLNPHNILFGSDSITIIDYESIHLGSIYFDLASFIVLHNLSNEQEQCFLYEYFGRELEKSELQKLNANKCLTAIYYGLILVDTIDEEGRLEYALALRKQEQRLRPLIDVLKIQVDIKNKGARLELGLSLLYFAQSLFDKTIAPHLPKN